MALSHLANNPVFTSILSGLRDPVLGILVGLGLTTILQSSSASIGLLQALASQGLVDMQIAFPILFGDNIGTTTTALISSIGTNKTAKRAAVMHFIFNVGTLIFIFGLRYPIEAIVIRITPLDVQRQIANAHTLFNLVNVVIQLPFANLLVKMATKLVPGEVEEAEEIRLKYLDARILETPSIAIGQAIKEVTRMAQIVKNNLELACRAFIKKNEKLIEEVLNQEIVINKLETGIVEYLIQLSKEPLTGEQHSKITELINVVNDIERVGDHSENIAELAQEIIRDNLPFSDIAIEEMNNITNKSIEVFKNAVESFKETNFDKARNVVKLEEEIDELETRVQKQSYR